MSIRPLPEQDGPRMRPRPCALPFSEWRRTVGGVGSTRSHLAEAAWDRISFAVGL